MSTEKKTHGFVEGILVGLFTGILGAFVKVGNKALDYMDKNDDGNPTQR